MAKVAKRVVPKVCHCKVCGRPLKNAQSMAKGMGPQCERKVLGVVRGASLGKPKRNTKCEWRQLWLFGETPVWGGQNE